MVGNGEGPILCMNKTGSGREDPRKNQPIPK